MHNSAANTMPNVTPAQESYMRAVAEELENSLLRMRKIADYRSIPYPDVAAYFNSLAESQSLQTVANTEVSNITVTPVTSVTSAPPTVPSNAQTKNSQT